MELMALSDSKEKKEIEALKAALAEAQGANQLLQAQIAAN